MPPWHESYRDIALTVVGAATGLASVVLVFVGFLLSTAGSFSADTDDAIPLRYTRLARLGLVPLVLCCVVMLAGFWWLFNPESVPLLKAWAWGFPAATVVFMAYAIWTVYVI